MTAERYTLHAEGELQAKGRYEATSTHLTIHSDDGGSEVLTLDRKGARLTLVAEDGTRIVPRRWE